MKRALALLVLCCAPWCAESQVSANNGVRGVAVAIYTPAPKYPTKARINHWTGAGVFVCTLRPDGNVSAVYVRQSTGHEILDQAAVEALRNWRVMVRGNNRIQVPINFTMSGIRHRMSGAVISD